MTLPANTQEHRRSRVPARFPDPSLALYDGDVLVGWVTARSLCFGGFTDERHAAQAAWLAHVALAQWIARQRYAPMPDPTPPPLRILTDPQDGAYWVLADGAPIARLLPAHASPEHPRLGDAPASDPTGDDGGPGSAAWDDLDDVRAPSAPAPPSRDDAPRDATSARADDALADVELTAGFEITLPVAVDELGARTAAFLVYRAFHTAGLPGAASTPRGGHLRPVSLATVKAVPTVGLARRQVASHDAPAYAPT